MCWLRRNKLEYFGKYNICHKSTVAIKAAVFFFYVVCKVLYK